MILVGGVTASVVDVVDVIAVRHADVAAAPAVLVRVVVVSRVADGLAFVDVSVVRTVQMPVVGVVDVIAVRHGHMAASRPVSMIMNGMSPVLCHRCHR
ncbi:hypothetical protein [Actinoallomurus liliacearum]|uniref:hypothetical protein n=1 Tax=Actinoallomurus liliacearum TaxID=1080073 RepID=UPI0031EB2DF1